MPSCYRKTQYVTRDASLQWRDSNHFSMEIYGFKNHLKGTSIEILNHMILAHLNINSIRNKIELLFGAVKGTHGGLEFKKL